MRILHTSDWHLGKKLERFSRLQEQKAVMSEICDIADSQKIDVVVIAGDVFDTFNPPIEALELFYHTLRKLSNHGNRPVVVIAGNHDSADRIEAPDPLARELGIVFVGYPHSKIKLFDLESGLSLINSDHGFLEFKLPSSEILRIILTPYANQQRIKRFLGVENSEDELRNILKKSWRETAKKYCDNRGVNILLSHLFFAKKGDYQAKEPDDEKPILHIGGAQVIYSNAIPQEIQYTALGHLHRKQIIDETNSPVVYCGTPIAYSFSENNQQKYVAIADINAGTKADIDFVVLKQGKKLLRNTFNCVDLAINWLNENQHALVEITLEMETYLTADEKKSLYDSHPGIVNVIPKVNVPAGESSTASQSINLNDDLSDLFKQFFASRNGNQQPNQELIDLLNEVISEPVLYTQSDKSKS
jgi:DNA repair protein SbcD/Mre11